MENHNRHLRDHDYTQQLLIIQEDKNKEKEEILLEQPETYRTLPGVQRKSTIYVDNVGYKYYKRTALVKTISLICERHRNHSRPICYGTASISKDITDNRLSMQKVHNHNPDEIDFNVPFLRQSIAEKGLEPFNLTVSVKTIYNNEIIQHATASKNYTQQQAYRRVFRMRSLLQPNISQDNHESSVSLKFHNYSRNPL